MFLLLNDFTKKNFIVHPPGILLRIRRKIVDFQLFENLWSGNLEIYPTKFLQIFVRESFWCVLWHEKDRIEIGCETKEFFGVIIKKVHVLSIFQTHLKNSRRMSSRF